MARGRRHARAIRTPAPSPPFSLASEWRWLGLGLLALSCLLWACRGVRLGTPVADDYAFLNELGSGRPLDLLGPMGSPLYWRPISRQLYFAAFGPMLFDRPWIVAAFHAVLLLGLFVALYRIGRRAFAPTVAAAAATFPLLGEPTRVLFAWPSGGEYLLAALCTALAVHEAIAGRMRSAALAAAAAMLSHEAATLVLPSLPAIAWARHEPSPRVVRWVAIALGLGLLSVIGHSIARTHGMGLPSDAPWQSLSVPAVAEVFRATVVAQLNLEDQPVLLRAAGLLAFGALLASAGVLSMGREARARIARARWLLAGSALWFAAATVPLAVLLPDWNGWRTFFPALGLGLALAGFLGLAAPRLLAAFVVLRLAALALSPSAHAVVELEAPPAASQLSFVRLARLGRTLESTRHELRARYRTLPSGAQIQYLGIPNLVLFGFEDSLAVRVWYGDSKLGWRSFRRDPSGEYRTDALVEYEGGRASPARVVAPGVVREFVAGLRAMESRRNAEADSLFARAQAGHAQTSGPLAQTLWTNRAILSLQLGRYAEADSFNRASRAIAGETADYWALAAHLELMRSNVAGAQRAVERCLALDESHAEGRALAAEFSRPPPAAPRRP